MPRTGDGTAARVWSRRVPLALAAACALVIAGAAQSGRPPTSDWPAYGGGAEQGRYSELSQINTKNVSRLRVAWQFDPHEGVLGGRFQVNPVVVAGVIYTTTPGGSVIALDGETGTLRWSWNSGARAQGRGVTYWSSGQERRVLAGIGRYVYALDAVTGQLVTAFGSGGRIDLHQNLGRDPERQSVLLSTPGVIYRDTYIVGGRTAENLPASPGDIRAYDVRSGTLKWSFHTIPHPGEAGHDTWPADAWTYSGGANSWAGMAVDVERGLVFAPTGSAASDFYGANRTGNNLFANSLLALDAETGERRWHFQIVRHDTWDRDLPSPPTLITVRRNGRRIAAVAQATKHGYLFLFDRTTGAPLFPIEYRAVPASIVEGEVSAATQPFPTKPAPFARQLLTEALLTQRTPAVREWARAQFRMMRSAGQFVPLSVGQETVVFPGFDGGAEWGGSAFDPASGLLFLNSNDVAWSSSLRPNEPAASLGQQRFTAQCAACHGQRLEGGVGPALADVRTRRTVAQVTDVVRQGTGRMPGFAGLTPAAVDAVVQFVMGAAAATAAPAAAPPADPRFVFTGFHKFLDPDGYPAVAPPWGTLNAIRVDTGEYAWRVPLGEYPELVAQGMGNTGSENYGGPIVTAGGLVFIAATNFDRKVRAFDKGNGRLLWEATMVNSGNATPATYSVRGKQYVVVPAFGGYPRPGTPPVPGARGGGPSPDVGTAAASGGAFVAFALP